MTETMSLISSDRSPALTALLDGFDCPAILVSADYAILATNRRYVEAFGSIEVLDSPRCFQVSHGYDVPCDQAGEDCPLGAARRSGHKERVLHVHQTPRGKEHVDVEMLPIHDEDGSLLYFIELLKPVPLASGDISSQQMVGESPPFKQMLGKLSRVGGSEASVLLLGESGTGKELAAKAIHMLSPRKDEAMVTLECAGLSDALFESELFGHVKGAFTGAHSNKKGLVELANNGSLFLDELGDIPLSMQVKLLRLLETGTFRALGSAELKSSDFRLICATHKDLLSMVERGEFRADLYYRVNVFPVRLPALRERLMDLPQLATTLLGKLEDGQNYELSQAAIDRLKQYSFPGNIRELRNLLNRAQILSDTRLIDAATIEQCFDSGTEIGPEVSQSRVVQKPASEVKTLKALEADYIAQLLEQEEGDKLRVAELLGISLRSLYRKLNDDRKPAPSPLGFPN
ncbi:MAG: transcriptional regulator [Pseudohongiella sp.]|nr:MAG: transcriptional regulator [Pseudohongiella sp.]